MVVVEKANVKEQGLKRVNRIGSSSLLLIKENQENPSSAVLALRASVVVHGFVPVNKFPHKS